MWFSDFYDKEKINFLFGGDLAIEDSTLECIVFSDISKITLTFYSDSIPKTMPYKWQQRGYNSIIISLNFTAVRNIRMSGGSIGFRCCPQFVKSSYGMTVSIYSPDFELDFEAESGAISRLEGILL